MVCKEEKRPVFLRKRREYRKTYMKKKNRGRRRRTIKCPRGHLQTVWRKEIVFVLKVAL